MTFGGSGEIRPTRLEPEALATIGGLLRQSFPRAHHLDAAYLAWGYLQNPGGRGIAFDALQDGRPVAHFGSRVLHARLDGEPARGLLMVDAATRPEARGRGLFSTLGNAILDAGREQGFGFALAAPNRRSLGLFQRGLGFQHLCPLAVRVGIGPTRAAPRPAPPLQLEPEWNRERVAWRLRRPGLAYRARRSGGRCRVLAPGGILGIWIEVADLPEELVPASVPELATMSPLRAWIGLDAGRSWRRSPHLYVPVSLRPAPLHLAFRDLRRGSRPLDARRVRLCALDFDAY